VGAKEYSSLELGISEENIIGRNLLNWCGIRVSIPSISILNPGEVVSNYDLDDIPALFFNNKLENIECLKIIPKFKNYDDFVGVGNDTDGDLLDSSTSPKFDINFSGGGRIDNTKVTNEMCYSVSPVVNFYDLFKFEKMEVITQKMIYNLLKINESLKGFAKVGFVNLKILNRDKLIFRPQYSLSEFEKDIISKEIKKFRGKGVIVDAPFSRINNPVMCVSKSNGEYRLVVDFRELNKNISDESNQLPRVKEIFNHILRSKSSIFTRLDLLSAYNQLLLNPIDRIYTSFTNPSVNGKIEKLMFTSCPFGLKTLPYIFQNIMQQVINETKIKKICVYQDDIIVFGDNAEEHFKDVIKLLETLNVKNMKINMKKSLIGSSSIKILGFIIENQKLLVDKEKLVNIFQPGFRPTTGKNLQCLLGFLNYFRDFVPSYSDIVEPLEKIKFSKNILWNEDFENKIQVLLDLISNSPGLVFPNGDEFQLYTDASERAISAVLKQDKNFIGFASRVLKKYEEEYSIVKKEILAIVWAVEHFKDFLLGNFFKILTYNKGLLFVLNVYSSTSKKNSSFIKNSIWSLQRFNFRVEFISSKENFNADMLTRVHGKLLKINDVIEESNDSALKLKKVIFDIHQLGHFSKSYMVNFLKIVLKMEITKEIMKEINETINGCLKCKYINVGNYGFSPIKNFLCKYPLQTLTMDILIMNYSSSTSSGNNAILVVIDVFSRYCFLFPIGSKSAIEIAEKLCILFSNYGFPDKLFSDFGNEFNNNILKLVENKFGIEHVYSPVSYHEGNGLTERYNRTILNVILKHCREELLKVKEWDKVIYFTQFVLNQKINTLYNSNPFFVLHGRCGWNQSQLSSFGINLGKEKTISEEDNNKLIKMHLDNWKFITECVYKDISNKMKKKKELENIEINKNRKIKSYKVGEVVMMKVNTKNKLEIRWIGPFKISNKTTSGFYDLICKGGEVAYKNTPTSFLSKSNFKNEDVLSWKDFTSFKLADEKIILEENSINEEEKQWKRKEGLRILERVDYKKLNEGE